MLILSIKHLTLFRVGGKLEPYEEADQSKSKTLFLFACHITSCEVFLLDIFSQSQEIGRLQ